MNDLLNTSELKTDLAYQWILAILPGPGSAYGAAFAALSGSLTFLGALLIGFFIVVGIVSSAHSGKVLGEKYHQVWAPLRVVVGFGMMIPIAGGFSAVHYALRDIVAPAAVNLGNAPIIAYIDHLASNGGDVKVAALQGQAIVDTILMKEICSAAWKGVDANMFAGQGAIERGFSQAYQPNGSRDLSIITDDKDMTWDYGVCGSLFTCCSSDLGS